MPLRSNAPRDGEDKALPFALYALAQYEEACRLIVLLHVATHEGCGPSSSNTTSKLTRSILHRKTIHVTTQISAGAVDLGDVAKLFKRVIGKERLVTADLKSLVENKKIQNEVDKYRKNAADVLRARNLAVSRGQTVRSTNYEPPPAGVFPEGWMRFSPIDKSILEKCMDDIFKLAEILLCAVRSLFGTTKESHHWTLHGISRTRKGDMAYRAKGDMTSGSTVALEIKRWGSDSLTKLVNSTYQDSRISRWPSHMAAMTRMPTAGGVRDGIINVIKKATGRKAVNRERVATMGITHILHQIMTYCVEQSAGGFVSLTDFMNGWVELEQDKTSTGTELKFNLRFWSFARHSDSLAFIDEEEEDGGDEHKTERPTDRWNNGRRGSEEEVKGILRPKFVPGDLHPQYPPAADLLAYNEYDHEQLVDMLSEASYRGWKPIYDYVSIGSQLGFQAFKFLDKHALGAPSVLDRDDINRRTNLDSHYCRTTPGAGPIIFNNTFWIPHEFTRLSSVFDKIASYTFPFLFTLFMPDFIVSGEEEDVTLAVNRTSPRGPLFYAPVTTTVPTRQGFILFALYSTIVIKVFYYEEHYEKELQVYNDMKGCPGILPLLATGVAPSGNRFIVLPYVGESMAEISDADA
ncbi:hypothetical protein D9611_006439 [Ephemerocybe angulata]|uniref:Uncharacterized protein n=1 Tax=Ephemerocybe angulata TaxID=980116 RepID=A0A8H5FG54_9AGAR|nr:hypothetical protein D9611_006439 [Tulosesus angulatus]